MNTDGNEKYNQFYGKSNAVGVYTDLTQSSQEDASSLERRSNNNRNARILV